MKVSYGDQLACALREVKFRERVYPRWVQAGKMTQAQATAQIAAMKEIAETLRPLAANEELPLGEPEQPARSVYPLGVLCPEHGGHGKAERCVKCILATCK